VGQNRTDRHHEEWADAAIGSFPTSSIPHGF
jgi:hypothetical protein